MKFVKVGFDGIIVVDGSDNLIIISGKSIIIK